MALDRADSQPRKSAVRFEYAVNVLQPSPEMENAEYHIGCSGKLRHATAQSGYLAIRFVACFRTSTWLVGWLISSHHVKRNSSIRPDSSRSAPIRHERPCDESNRRTLGTAQDC